MILTILRIMFLWFLLAGIFMFVHYKFKIKKEFVIPITFLVVILILFLASLLNVIKIVTILIYLFGLFGYYYLFIKKKLNKDFLKEFYDYKTIIIGSLILFVTIISYCLEFTSYDNFSHWALISKQLFMHDCLPSFEYNADDFTTYPPGSALFIYFIGLLVGKTEHAMILGQAYLIIGILSSLMVLFKDKNKLLSSILFIVFTLFIFVSNVVITDLLIDTLLGVLGILSVLFAYYYRDNIKKAGILLAMMSCVFIIFKNSGFLFITMNVLLMLIIGFRNKNIKKSLLYIVLMLLCAAGFFYLWQHHLLMVYYDQSGLTTKHSISVANAMKNLGQNGYENSLAVIDVYLKNFININNLINWYMIGINIVLILLICLYKNNRKNIFKVLILCDVLYLCYWAAYGVLYVLSMPFAEAIVLACYNRYMMSCIIVLIGIVLIAVYELCVDKKSKICLTCFIILFIFLIFNNGINRPYSLIGVDYYKGSERENIQKIIKENDLESYKQDNLIVYMEECSLETYISYMFRYELLKRNVRAACGNIDFSTINEETVIFVPNNNKEIIEKFDDDNFEKIKTKFYKYTPSN